MTPFDFHYLRLMLIARLRYHAFASLLDITYASSRHADATMLRCRHFIMMRRFRHDGCRHHTPFTTLSVAIRR